MSAITTAGCKKVTDEFIGGTVDDAHEDGMGIAEVEARHSRNIRNNGKSNCAKKGVVNQSEKVAATWSNSQSHSNNSSVDSTATNTGRQNQQKPRIQTESKCSLKGNTVEIINNQMDKNNDLYQSSVLPTPKKQSFSNAKNSILAKNNSTTDLTQYINPDLVLRRRASLLQNAFDPAMKKIRQKEAYKTAMCQAWLEGKKCAFGDQCNFAHGEDELQPLPANRLNPKYKTRICENYTTTGICPFGNRCFFIHPQTNSKADELTEYQQSLNETARQLEGEAIYFRPDTTAIGGNGVGRSGTPRAPGRKMGGKLKQFRKMETCGNLFFTQYKMQQIPVDYLGQHEYAKKMEKNFYEDFPPLSAVVDKKSHGREKIPLTHSNSTSNLHFKPFVSKTMHNSLNKNTLEHIPKEKELDQRRLIIRKFEQQHKSFSSNDIWGTTAKANRPKPLLMEMAPIEPNEKEESDSSGPHTPINYFDFDQQLTGGLASSSKWSSITSNNTVSNNMWYGIGGYELAPSAKAEEQKVPSFSLFGPSDQIANSNNDLRFGMLGGGGEVLGGGKRSPISDFEGILMGRRSSHTPYLDQDGETTQALLNVVFDQGMQKGRNRSAEFILKGRKEQQQQQKIRLMGMSRSDPWQSVARSMGALNDKFTHQYQSQFLPPEEGDATRGEGKEIGGEIAPVDSSGQGLTYWPLKETAQEQQSIIGSSNISLQPYLQIGDHQQMKMDAAVTEALGGYFGGTFISNNGLDYSSNIYGLSSGREIQYKINHQSILKQISHIQQEHFQTMEQQQSPYSSTNSLKTNSLADELVRRYQCTSNLETMKNIWASSSPHLEGNNQQGADERLKVHSNNTDNEESWNPFFHKEYQQQRQNVEIPFNLNFNPQQMNYDENFGQMSRQCQQSLEPQIMSRSNTLTNEDEKKNDQKSTEGLVKLYDSISFYDEKHCKNTEGIKTRISPSVILMEQSKHVERLGTDTWARRAMKKAFLLQKSHSSPDINGSHPN